MLKVQKEIYSLYLATFLIAIISLQHFCVFATEQSGIGLLDIPLGDELYQEVYDFVDRMLARKAVSATLKNTRPYSLGEVAYYLQKLSEEIESGNVKLSRVEQKRLRNLRSALLTPPETSKVLSGDFQSTGGSRTAPSPNSPSKRKIYYPPLFQTKGKEHQFALDFAPGWVTVSRQQEGEVRRIAHAALFRPTVYGYIKDSFAFYSDLRVYYLGKTKFPDIPKTEARMQQERLETATASLPHFYAKFKLPWFDVLVGEDNLRWGPGRHGALLLSDNPLPIDMIKLTASKKPIKFQALVGILEGAAKNRYISGHRLELHLWDKVNLGIAETIVFAPFGATYLNTLQIYTATDTPPKTVDGEEKFNSNNILTSGDIDVLALKNLEFYSELMIDDFVPTGGLRSYKHWGSKFGVLLGVYYINPFSLADADLRIEYAFINQFAYTHSPPITTYTHQGSVIGHRIGTDADDLWLSIKHYLTDKISASLSYERERHGEGDVNKPYSDADGEEWEFLSGVTETTNSLSLGLSYSAIGRYFANAEYTLSWIQNAQNELNQNSTRHQFILSGSYRF